MDKHKSISHRNRDDEESKTEQNAEFLCVGRGETFPRGEILNTQARDSIEGKEVA